jgi:endonuclease YncB( thermonuclease family)
MKAGFHKCTRYVKDMLHAVSEAQTVKYRMQDEIFRRAVGKGNRNVPLADVAELENKHIPPFSFSTNGARIPCKVLSVYDGDTLCVAMNRSWGCFSYKVRLAGIDTPEMKPPLDDPNRETVIDLAKKAKEFLESIILPHSILFIEILGQDKYGRLLGKMFLGENVGEESSINKKMIAGNFARPYLG